MYVLFFVCFNGKNDYLGREARQGPRHLHRQPVPLHDRREAEGETKLFVFSLTSS